MDARFSRNSLIQRIESIASRRDNIFVHNLDAMEYINTYIYGLPKNTFIYFDPPYFNKSSGLYLDRYTKSDHKTISEVIQKIDQKTWVVSYDAIKDIISLYENRRYILYSLQYNASSVYKGQEVFVFSEGLEIPFQSSLPFVSKALHAFWGSVTPLNIRVFDSRSQTR